MIDRHFPEELSLSNLKSGDLDRTNFSNAESIAAEPLDEAREECVVPGAVRFSLAPMQT